MRIQPHVWSAPDLANTAFISNVVRDAVCTHGHPRAIAGAAIHALTLAYILDSMSIPGPSQWKQFSQACDYALNCLTDQGELALMWSPNWERLTGQSLATAFAAVKQEWVDAAITAERISDSRRGSPAEAYAKILSALGGYDPAERGSGLKTPLFALALAWHAQDIPPEDGLLIAANAFGSDTDTIATMCGALLGAVADREPNGELQDYAYIRSEATRLYRISQGHRESSFQYPDTLNWTAPKAQRDAWLNGDDGPELSGLGPIEPYGDVFVSEKGTEMEWQWCRTAFGQTLLCKRKPTTGKMSGMVLAKPPVASHTQTERQAELDSSSAIAEPDIDETTQQCIRSGFDPKTIGEALLRVSSGVGGIERAIAFAAIIAKAKLARSR
jgi:hypothetical protein